MALEKVAPALCGTLMFAALSVVAGGEKVEDLLFQDELGMRTISPEVKPLRHTESPPPIPKAVARGQLYPQQYANDQQNSRLSTNIAAGAFRVRWQSPVNPFFDPGFVLNGAARVVVQAGEWQMLDLNGQSIATDRRSFGPVLIDEPNALMYYINPAGFLAARKLNDGTQLYNFLPRFGDSYGRTLISRQGQRMLIAGVEQPRGAHGDFEPSKSIIEAFDLGDRPTVDEMGNLTSLVGRGTLIVPSIGMLTAAVGDEVVAAIPDRIYLMDQNLKIKAAFEAEFAPLAMSLDEAGRIYLVSSAKDHIHLSLITPAGDQLYSFDLPPGTNVTQPPIVDYDHTAYLVAGQRIIAVDQHGKLKWSKNTPGSVAGASVTTDDHLLVAEGGTVALYDDRGVRRQVFQAGEEFVTPPILTAKGEILVASKTHLYCLTAEAR